jgi:hypothetical protein
LIAQQVYSGEEFQIDVSFPVIEPGSPWHAVFACPGYAEAASEPFQLGAGWGDCPVELGTVMISRPVLR